MLTQPREGEGEGGRLSARQTPPPPLCLMTNAEAKQARDRLTIPAGAKRKWAKPITIPIHPPSPRKRTTSLPPPRARTGQANPQPRQPWLQEPCRTEGGPHRKRQRERTVTTCRVDRFTCTAVRGCIRLHPPFGSPPAEPALCVGTLRALHPVTPNHHHHHHRAETNGSIGF